MKKVNDFNNYPLCVIFSKKNSSINLGIITLPNNTLFGLVQPVMPAKSRRKVYKLIG